MKSQPPVISSNQMLRFLQTFPGNEQYSNLTDLTKTQLNDQEIKSRFKVGYKQLNERIKYKLKNLNKIIDYERIQ